MARSAQWRVLATSPVVARGTPVSAIMATGDHWLLDTAGDVRVVGTGLGLVYLFQVRTPGSPRRRQ
ncbi:hypothetical protein [Streptomyces sp. NPDC017991]|uniref:hypothetical protein n=1 Tax=Streptomyces sp. NPDC017991 TaxID=3365026 RepID=UPI0037A3D295